MRYTTAVVTLTCLCSVVGCQRQGKQELAAVPPPADPVQVQGYQAEPVQFAPVAPAPAQPSYVAPVPTPVPAQASYTIQKGDSLWKIAERHYGNGQRWPDIVAANPGPVPEKLPVGKTIVLP